MSCSCSLHAGSRLANHLALARLVPFLKLQHGFDCIFILTTLDQLFIFIQLHDTYLTDISAFSNLRSAPWLFAIAPSGGLEPAPECRFRGSSPHLLHSILQLLVSSTPFFATLSSGHTISLMPTFSRKLTCLADIMA